MWEVYDSELQYMPIETIRFLQIVCTTLPLGKSGHCLAGGPIPLDGTLRKRRMLKNSAIPIGRP